MGKRHMSNIKINCPHCKQPLEIPEEKLGTIVDCPSCKQFNTEIQKLMSDFDEFLKRWQALHQKYKVTPSTEKRNILRKKIKALEEDYQDK